MNRTTNDKIIYYEVIRLRQNALLFLEAHIDRLLKSLTLGGHQNLTDKAAIQQAIFNYIKTEGVKTANIRVTITVGQAQLIGVTYIKSAYPTASVYQNGVAAETAEFMRHAPNVKQQSEALMALRANIAKRAIYDFLLVDKEGFITEGSKTNVFFIKEETVYTAPLNDVLAGITRAEVIKCIPSYCQFKEVAIHKSDLKNCDAAFLTGTSIDILPISKIDNRIYQSSSHAIVKDMIQQFAKKVNSDIANHQLNY